MKLAVTREALLAGLQKALPAVAAKHYLPIMTHFLVEASKPGLRIYATDLEQAVGTLIEADVEATGILAIPARLLLGLVKEIPAGTVRLRLVGTSELVLEFGRSQARIKGLGAEEFPAFPEVKFGTPWKVNVGELSRMVSLVSYAASREESRPVLSGILWELTSQQMRLVALDRHRLAMVTVPGKWGRTGQFRPILPPKALRMVGHLFGEEEVVEVAATDSHVGFRSGQTQLVTRLIEGPYPNYDLVIPKEPKATAVVGCADLIAALRRVLHVTGDQHRVALTFNEKSVSLLGRTSDLGEAKERITASVEGEALRVGANGRYLLDLLGSMPTDEVRIGFNGPEKALTFEPEGGDGSMLALVQPMRIDDLAEAPARESAAA